MCEDQGIVDHDKRLRSIPHGGFDYCFDLVGAVDAKDRYSPSSLSGGFLKRFSRSFRPWVLTIPKHGGTPEIWKEFTEHFNLLRAYLSDLIACSSDVPARTGQATYQPAPTISATVAMTIGMVGVAFLAAVAPGTP